MWFLLFSDGIRKVTLQLLGKLTVCVVVVGGGFSVCFVFSVCGGCFFQNKVISDLIICEGMVGWSE